MLFNSYIFIFLFMPVTLAVYFFLNRKRLTIAAGAWLLFASLFFYCWWNPKYLVLIVGSILFNYSIGSLLIAYNSLKIKIISRRVLFLLGVGANLGLLAFFKYSDFFMSTVNDLFKNDLQLLHVVLPLGISFFTITQIAFLVDAYEGLVEERKLLNYALFVTFFPHLLAGPILHHRDMMPQFEVARNRVLNYRNLAFGISLFFMGLFKKACIADQLSPYVRAGFDGAADLHFIEAWAASLSYTLQLYFDFSGYSDMAVGIGLMFNIRLPVNFNSPYKATNIIDFWNRWHITLTGFLTSYVYAPAVRSFRRITFSRSMLAILLTMLVSGLWHGAARAFVAWGLLHGAALVVNHSWRRLKLRMPGFLCWMVTFLFVNASFVIFRSKEWKDAARIFRGMAGLGGLVLPERLAGHMAGLRRHGVTFTGDYLAGIHGGRGTLLLLLVFSCIVFFSVNSMEIRERLKPDWKWAFYVAGMAVFGVIFVVQKSEFLYFRF